MSIQEKLDGWDEITAYLRCDRKSVQRRGYPIRRHITGRVYAMIYELTEYELSTNAHKQPQTPVQYS